MQLRIEIVHLQIYHSAAFCADKVIVRRGIGIKVVYAVAYAQATAILRCEKKSLFPH